MAADGASAEVMSCIIRELRRRHVQLLVRHTSYTVVEYDVDVCLVLQVDTRRRNILHVAADGASAEVMSSIIRELRRRRVNVRRLVTARDKYIGGELCMLIRGKDKGRDSWHYVEVRDGERGVFRKGAGT